MKIKDGKYFNILLHNFNFLLPLVHVRWSEEKVMEVSHDQQHHFYTLLLEYSRMLRKFSYFYSRGDPTNFRNHSKVRTREKRRMTVLLKTSLGIKGKI
jgi:hypothetical protein